MREDDQNEQTLAMERQRSKQIKIFLKYAVLNIILAIAVSLLLPGEEMGGQIQNSKFWDIWSNQPDLCFFIKHSEMRKKKNIQALCRTLLYLLEVVPGTQSWSGKA